MTQRLSRHALSRRIAPMAGACVSVGVKALENLRQRRPRITREGIRVTEVAEFDERINRFWEEAVREGDRITIMRDQAYLNWRFVRNPNASYRRFVAEQAERIVGYVVTSVSRGPTSVAGNVVDLLVLQRSREAVDWLIERAIEALRDEGVDLIQAWTIRGNRRHAVYERAFRRHHFWVAPAARWPMVVRANYARFPKAYVLDPNNWYITMAFTEGTF